MQCRYETSHSVPNSFSCDPRLTFLCMPQRERANVPLEAAVRSDGVRIRSAYRGITSIIEEFVRIAMNSIEASCSLRKRKSFLRLFLAREGNNKEPGAFTVGRDLPLNRRQLVKLYFICAELNRFCVSERLIDWFLHRWMDGRLSTFGTQVIRRPLA